MFKRIPLLGKLLAILALFTFLSFASVSTAFASTGTGTQNPDLTVSVSYTSNGANPDQATVGDTVTLSASVTNNTARKLSVQLTAQVVAPGVQYTTPAVSVTLQPGQTLTQTASFTVESFLPKGTYSLTLSASDKNGTSSATGSITIV